MNVQLPRTTLYAPANLTSVAQNSDLPISIILEHSLLKRNLPDKLEIIGAVLILIGTSSLPLRQFWIVQNNEPELGPFRHENEAMKNEENLEMQNSNPNIYQNLEGSGIVWSKKDETFADDQNPFSEQNYDLRYMWVIVYPFF